MPARWIGAEVFADGIREFAARVAAEVTQPDELMYLLNFPDSGYDVLIGIEGFGMIMSWAVCCGDAPQSEDAPALVQQNWGGVEGSCFYFSVHLEDDGPALFLETRQFLHPDTTAKDITRILGTWHVQFSQAKLAPRMGIVKPSAAELRQSFKEMMQSVANRYKWQCEEADEGFWTFVDTQNWIQFGVEFMESDDWLWTFQALVLDVNKTVRLDPLRLLRLNDGKGEDGLVWSFYALGSHELGESLYLKYGAITPVGDLSFASKVIATVLRNMQKFTLRTRKAI
jgi:hypothetical protein